VRRFLRVVVHNWPLKLAAIGLATLLYGGLVVGQSTQPFNGNIPIKVENLPAGTFVLKTIDPVTEVRYFSPSGAVPINSTFSATVDVSGVTPGSGKVSLPVTVEATGGITPLSWTPQSVTVELDELTTRDNVPVRIDYGTPPDGFEVGKVTVEPSTVSISGPASVVDQVVAVHGDVLIQGTGLSVDQDVLLTPIDQVGNTISPINVVPRTARVTIPVFENRKSRTVPVRPVITGSPAAGFEVASIIVEPTAVTIEGGAEQLSELAEADTDPVSVTGASSTVNMTVGLDLPTGLVALGDDSIHVTVTLRPVTSTRTFEVGVRLVGARSDLTYSVPVDRVLITIGGSIADLDRLEGSALLADLAVGELGLGTSDVPVTIQLPVGLTLVSASPSTVQVTVTAPASSPAAISPSPGG